MQFKALRFTAIIFAAGFSASMMMAAELPPTARSNYDLSALKWRNIGPNRGGRSQAGAGSAARPLEYYFGADGGGLWKTTDGGTVWHPVTDGKISSSSVSAVAVLESNPDIVYIGTGETALRGDIIQGDGVYKSVDAGKTWIHMGLSDSQAIARVRVDPKDPNVVYVAALGHPYGPSNERGIFRSRDGGTTWKRILFRNDRAGAIDLAMDSHNPQILFASIWDVYRTPWTLSSGGPGSGLFKSVDGGDTWTEITRNPGMPKDVLGKITVAISGANPSRIYAMVEAKDGGLFRSDDAGATWTLVNSDRNLRQRAFYFSRITADPTIPDRLYAMNVEIYRSDDGGKTFKQISTPHADHHGLWIAPDNPRRMIAVDDGGAAVSVDGGKTWTSHAYPTAQFYHVSTTSEFPYNVCGAQQDDGTACVPSDPVISRHDPYPLAAPGTFSVGTAEAGFVTPDPKNPDIFYVGDQAGIISRYNRRTGEQRSVTVDPLFFSGMASNAIRERWQWTFPIVFSPVDPTILYTSSQHLWKTTTEGQRWEKISPDLTRDDPKTLGDSGGPITKDQNGPEIYGTIFTIAPSRFDVNTIWTGSDDGVVSITRDGGKSWKNVTPAGIGDFNRISFMDASTHDRGGAYLAAKRYQLDDRHPYIFKTHDYGKTWTKIVNGIPDNDFAQVVREDPVRRGLLYAGTEHGIYVSFDDGDHWQSLSLNLPDTQVADLTVADNDLVIATHGRSFYVLDNIAMLRQYTPEVLQQKAFLFAPSPAIRTVKPATIDYYLSERGTKVVVDILDGKGAVIQSFSSAPANTSSTGGKSDPGDNLPKTTGKALPTTNVGTNRFVWDLRYPGGTTFPGLIMRYANPGVGPLAPPGKYSVRLTANGQTQIQPLIIERDPRLKNVSDDDQQEQFKLAMQIRDKTSLANATVIRIRSIDSQLDQRVSEAKDSSISAQAATIKSKLDELEQEIYQVKNRSPRDTLNYPIKLNNQLAVLEMLVDLGDRRPTDQDYTVFHELSARLDKITGQVDQIVATDLKTLNEQLAGRHIPAVIANSL